MLRSTQAAPSGTRPRLLFFFTPTEGVSRRTEGYLAQVLQRRRNHNAFLIHHIDVSQRRDLAERFRVTETPAILVVADGKVRVRLVRPKGCNPISEQLKPWMR